MRDRTQLRIGSDVLGVDGVAGDLTRVIVDPVGRVLTHLVVGTAHSGGPGRLVPIGLVASVGDVISLRCTVEQFEGLEVAEESHFLPGAEESWGYRQEHIASWPFYSLAGRGRRLTTHDRVPVGEVEIRRGERVHAADGDIGRVRGLVVDADDHYVTHVLLDEGHLWGKKLVAIPIGAVTGVEQGITLKITKSEVADLPPVEVEGQD